MNFKKIKELSLEIAKLQKELNKQKEYALEYCKEHGVSKLIKKNGVVINYYPANTTTKIDTKALKDAGLYDKYSYKTVTNEYIKISIKEVL